MKRLIALIIAVSCVVFTASAEQRLLSKIIGGGFANPNQFSVGWLVSSNGTSCSGTAISRTAILTAGHCIRAFGNGSRVLATLGTQKLPVIRGILAPGGFDLGIAVIQGRINANPYQFRSGLYPNVRSNVLAMGYGNPNVGSLSFTYLQVLRYLNTEMFAAVGSNGSAPCTGDSGGPALIGVGGGVFIVGVVSAGQSAVCSLNSQTAFVTPSSPRIANWLNSVISTYR